MDDLISTREVIDKIVAYKNKLEKIPKDKLNDNQKIWLLACTTSEARISTSPKDQIAEDMFLLLRFIPNEG
jgi:hypothetical protein